MTSIDQLLRIVKVQEVDLFFTEKGFSRKYIYDKIIRPNFFVGTKRTYYRLLDKNAKAELKKRGIDWRDELENNKPTDYQALMEILKNKDPLDIATYHKMLKDGGKH